MAANSIFRRLFANKSLGIRRPNPAQRPRLAVQNLEDRSLMAASLTASMNTADGILRIEGTYGADRIHVRDAAHHVRIDGIRINLTDGATTTSVASILRSGITRIDVAALDGNDVVEMHDSFGPQEFPIPMVIHGGMGNDTLIGGKAADQIFGESGTDSLIGGAGNDHVYGDANPAAAEIVRKYHLQIEPPSKAMSDQGTNEKWVMPKTDYSNVTYYPLDYITPDGSLYHYATWGNGTITYFNELITTLDASYYDDLRKLEPEFGLFNYNLYYGGGNRDEKWLLGEGDPLSDGWFFITPVGEVYRWDGLNWGSTIPAAGTYVATLDHFYHADPTEFVAAATDDASRDVLIGQNGDDSLYGAGGNDSILGGDGNDVLYGGDGKDTLKGGSDNDTAFGEVGNDWVQGNLGMDTLNGGDGTDTLAGDTGNDRLIGENDNDLLFAGTGNDTVIGCFDGWHGETGNANDTLYGADGNDSLYAGDGDDKLYGENGDDWLWGEDGDDKLYGADNNDALDGGRGLDVLEGGTGNDNLVGGEDLDILKGGSGHDNLWGASWQNNYTYQDAGNFLYGQEGNDNLWGGNGSDQLYGGSELDNLYGGHGDDDLYGEGGNDHLWGDDDGGTAAGEDKLYGGPGSDTLRGGPLNDWLDAGSLQEYADGGDGRDFNAWVTAINGARYQDIDQGAANTCWILSSMGAMTRQGIDLSQRIRYLGDNVYAVSLFNRKDISNPWTGGFKAVTEYVTFDGSRTAADANFDSDISPQEGESWVIIMQRAIIQAVSRFDPSQTITNPHSGGAMDPLSILTGVFGTSQAPSAYTGSQQIADLVNAGKKVVIHTKNEGTSVLDAFHCYTVLGGNSLGVHLYNPHGSEVWVSWAVFQADVNSVVSV